MTEPIEYLYSTDDEEYVYASLTDCLRDMFYGGEYEDAEVYTVFRAKAAPLDVTTMCNSLAIDTINNCTDYICERVGFTYDSGRAESKESRASIRSSIEQWVYQYTSAKSYKEIVGKPKKLTLTSKEVQELLNA